MHKLTCVLFLIHQNRQFSNAHCHIPKYYRASDLYELRFSCADIQHPVPCQSKNVLSSVKNTIKICLLLLDPFPTTDRD